MTRPRRTIAAHLPALAATLTLATTLGGCIRAPDVVIVDRRTALEAEAAGRFAELEEALDVAAIRPQPSPLTRATLEAAGWRPSAEDDAIEAMTRTHRDEATRVDDLLRRKCIGESLAGTLRPTPSTCAGAVDAADVGRVIERINRSRQQIWLWMARKAPGVSAESLQRSWRKHHLERVVCGGWVEVEPETWRQKACE